MRGESLAVPIEVWQEGILVELFEYKRGVHSLGDRACLALGARMGCPVITADRAWASLGLDVEVTLIR